MFRTNRCNDTSFKYQSTNAYPEATPQMAPQMSQSMMMPNMMGCGNTMPPIYECPQERVVHREIMHEVPHICPINTRIINHQIYRHTFTPCYTCCEENEVCNVYDGNCCNY